MALFSTVASSPPGEVRQTNAFAMCVKVAMVPLALSGVYCFSTFMRAVQPMDRAWNIGWKGLGATFVTTGMDSAAGCRANANEAKNQLSKP